MMIFFKDFVRSVFQALKKLRRVLLKLPHAWAERRVNQLEFTPPVARQIFRHYLGERQVWEEEYIEVVSAYMDDFLRPVWSNFQSSLSQNHIRGANPTKIWFCWLQGEAAMPSIVAACYHRIRKIFSDVGHYQVTLITSENWQQFLSLPNYIGDKVATGKICPAHFADIIRWGLVARHGGCWFDACDYLTHDDADRYAGKLGQFSFFTARFPSPASCPGEPSRGKWCNGYFMALPENPVAIFVYTSLLYYWKHHERPLDYVFLDYILWTGYSKLPELTALLDAIPANNTHFYEFRWHVNEPYTPEEWQKYMKMCDFQNISYKLVLQEFTPDGTLTNYGHLLRENKAV